MAMTLGVMSCREVPTNWDLDYQWQVMTVEYPDGTVLEPEQCYYCFYRHTAQLRKADGGAFTANMTEDGDVITLEFPHSNPKLMKDWGILPPDDAPTTHWLQTYTINKLSSSRLVMTTADNGVVITCRKF